jgi:DsbC/DsbD-like thiol-disulfide interchange protein
MRTFGSSINPNTDPGGNADCFGSTLNFQPKTRIDESHKRHTSMSCPKFWQPLLLITLFCADPTTAADGQIEPITVSLISTANGIQAGKKFTLGIHQKMLPGFHSYWKNPGTLGMPLQMEWQLPTGFRAGPIQWPVPLITKMAAYNVWGYEQEALLLVDIHAPTDLKTGTTVTIKGTAAWMCCGKSCHPGHGELALALPVVQTAQPSPAWHSAVQKNRAEQPVTSNQWQLECRQDNETYSLIVRPHAGDSPNALIRSLGRLQFFGYERVISSDKGQQIKIDEDSITLFMKREEHTPDDSPNRLTGMLVAEGEWINARHVLAVDIPIQRLSNR